MGSISAHWDLRWTHEGRPRQHVARGRNHARIRPEGRFELIRSRWCGTHHEPVGLRRLRHARGDGRWEEDRPRKLGPHRRTGYGCFCRSLAVAREYRPHRSRSDRKRRRCHPRGRREVPASGRRDGTVRYRSSRRPTQSHRRGASSRLPDRLYARRPCIPGLVDDRAAARRLRTWPHLPRPPRRSCGLPASHSMSSRPRRWTR